MSYLSNTVLKVTWFCSDDPVNHITELDLSMTIGQDMSL